MQINFIRPDEVDGYLRKGAVFIDVREQEEYEKGHIPSAISMPYDLPDEKYKKLSMRPFYIVYCDRGSTSILAARKLGRLGYRVASLSGGYEALQEYREEGRNGRNGFL